MEILIYIIFNTIECDRSTWPARRRLNSQLPANQSGLCPLSWLAVILSPAFVFPFKSFTDRNDRFPNPFITLTSKSLPFHWYLKSAKGVGHLETTPPPDDVSLNNAKRKRICPLGFLWYHLVLSQFFTVFVNLLVALYVSQKICEFPCWHCFYCNHKINFRER